MWKCGDVEECLPNPVGRIIIIGVRCRVISGLRSNLGRHIENPVPMQIYVDILLVGALSRIYEQEDKMKIFGVFSIAFIVIACLLAGCGGDEEAEVVGPDGEGELEEYMGLASMKVGSWAEHVSPEGDREKYEYLGEDTWEGKACFLMEIESSYDGEETISQIWIDKTNGEAVLFLIKMDESVMRMDISQVPDVPGEETVEEDEGNVEKIGTDSYTTPTGKTVQATIYKATTTWGTDEYWVSGEVPFGDVKDISNGELLSSLYDFGDSGADRSISKQEAENAESFGFPFLPDVGITL